MAKKVQKKTRSEWSECEWGSRGRGDVDGEVVDLESEWR